MAFAHNFRAAFLYLVVATFVDATDGVLARGLRVKERLPQFDGALLDNIVDYLTYVFVPALIVWQADLVPSAFPICAAMLLSSAYGFAQSDAKVDSADHFFTGFPSYWNIVAVYLYAARLGPAVSAGILLVLSALVFVRNGYVYPTRTPVLRGLTIALGAVWGVMVLTMIAWMPDVPGALVIVSLFFPVYYAVLSFMLDARRGHRS